MLKINETTYSKILNDFDFEFYIVICVNCDNIITVTKDDLLSDTYCDITSIEVNDNEQLYIVANVFQCEACKQDVDAKHVSKLIKRLVDTCDELKEEADFSDSNQELFDIIYDNVNKLFQAERD